MNSKQNIQPPETLEESNIARHSTDDSIVDDDDDDDEEICLICGEYAKDETWYRCTSCARWVYEECSGVTTAKNYTCDFCCSVDKSNQKIEVVIVI